MGFWKTGALRLIAGRKQLERIVDRGGFQKREGGGRGGGVYTFVYFSGYTTEKAYEEVEGIVIVEE